MRREDHKRVCAELSGMGERVRQLADSAQECVPADAFKVGGSEVGGGSASMQAYGRVYRVIHTRASVAPAARFAGRLVVWWWGRR